MKKRQVNIGRAERVTSVVAGAVLLYYGLRQRRLPAAGLALVAGDLLYRGATGRSRLYHLLGFQAVRPPERLRVDHAVTIQKSPEELYRFWHDLSNLPQLMPGIDFIRSLDDRRSHWIMKVPGGGTIEWTAEITKDKENEMISWHAERDADISHSGVVGFRPAPGGRGAEVRLIMTYQPPAGALTATVARLFGREPKQQAREVLRRFKQLMEAGEIATTEGQPSARRPVEVPFPRKPVGRAHPEWIRQEAV